MSVELFSVWQFFSDGTQEKYKENVPAEEAVKAARHCCYNVAANMGITVRVIIVDSDDYTNFEWKKGEGVVFP